MPTCHGSGGLAGQYRFGARSGASIIFLGAIKIMLGVVALWHQTTLVALLAGIPKSLLGVLVLAAGIELAKVGESVNTDARDLRVLDQEADEYEEVGGLGVDGKQVRAVDEKERKERWGVMLVTVAALLAFKNDGVGFMAGLTWHWGLKGARRIEELKEERGRYWWRRVEIRSGERAELLAGNEED